MKHILLVLAVMMVAFPAYASHNGKEHGLLKTITISVDGMVCDFCARALEKIFYQRQGVEGVDVNLDTHVVKIDVTEETVISDEEIKQMVTQAGYNVSKIER